MGILCIRGTGFVPLGFEHQGLGYCASGYEIFASGVGVLFISGRGLCIGDRTFLVIRGRVLSIRGRDFVHHG